jgi:hypothetical protein
MSKAESAAVMIAAIALIAVITMTYAAPDQWLYDTFVDRNQMMEN